MTDGNEECPPGMLAPSEFESPALLPRSTADPAGAPPKHHHRFTSYQPQVVGIVVTYLHFTARKGRQQ